LAGTYLIDSPAFALAWKLALLLTLIFWLSFAFWVFRDARHRVAHGWLVGTATLLGLAVPFIGPLVYMLFRPPEALADVRLRDAELRILEQSLAVRAQTCPVCRAGIQPDFLVCPVCTTRLKQACATCAAALEPVWQACPWCATPAGALVVQVDLDATLTAEAAMLARARAAAETRHSAA
jgi:Double zinc ribbon